MLKRREIDVIRSHASGALDLQPWEAAVDGLVNGGRRVDRLAIAPHPLVPAFAEKLNGLLDQRSALGTHLR